MKIVRGRLSAADVIPPNLRYDEDCDCVQFSPDNGTTWVDQPAADPRHSDAYRYPLLDTTDARCDAAANMVKWIKDFIDETTLALGDAATAFTVANIALGFFTLITGGTSVLLELIFQLGGTLADLGYAVLSAAFDSGQYDLMLCAFYCNIESDGSVTVDDLVAIEDQVTADLNTTAAIVTNLILQLQGEVGVSNAGTIGGETGDCEDCECLWCYTWDFTVDDGSEVWSPVAPYGTYSAGNGWRTVAGQGLILQGDFSAAEIVEISWSGTFFPGIGPNIWGTFWRSGGSNLFVDTGPLGGVPYSITSTDDLTINQIWLNPSGGNDADIYIQHVTIKGKGENPFGGDNC